jgi:hypothetical protein
MNALIRTRNPHCSFEELVEVICPLYELECDTDKKKFLELLYGKSTGAKADNHRGHKTTSSHNYVKNVPPVSAKTAPTKTKEANEGVDDIQEGEDKEEVI